MFTHGTARRLLSYHRGVSHSRKGDAVLPPSHDMVYQVLWLQLAAGGRKEALLGAGSEHARMAPIPFIVGSKFPGVYLEFPLIGDPFLDVTVLYSQMEPGTRVHSEAAPDTGRMLDWYATVVAEHEGVNCGFELDTHEEVLPRAAVHFQPRQHLDLVEPFCETIGEPEKARLYLDLARRMPPGWDLSFFGLFRGRPQSPLRVCGYLGETEKDACGQDPARLKAVFDEIGFCAYDDAMLSQVCTLLQTSPKTCDFQLDVYPDGHLGDTFAIDSSFKIERPELVSDSFKRGPFAKLFGLFEQWGIADERWKLAADAAFARGLPVEREDGSKGVVSLVLLPQWVKARWRNRVLQPAKLYYLGSSDVIDG